MNSFVINCIIKDEQCSLNVSLKKLSTLQVYDIYKCDSWIATVQRVGNSGYQVISYLSPIAPRDIDAIGAQIDLSLFNNNPGPVYRKVSPTVKSVNVVR